jgi:hypothetical protein
MVEASTTGSTTVLSTFAGSMPFAAITAAGSSGHAACAAPVPARVKASAAPAAATMSRNRIANSRFAGEQDLPANRRTRWRAPPVSISSTPFEVYAGTRTDRMTFRILHTGPPAARTLGAMTIGLPHFETVDRND